MSSAVAGAWPHPAFLIFTIGSVQEFVSTARRTQDSWMGSFLLSYLTWEAIKVIADQCGPDCLIYPSLQGQPLLDLWLREKKIDVPQPLREALQIANFPNMFTAIVPEDDAKSLAKKAHDALITRWKEIAYAVKQAVERAAAREMGVQLAVDGDWEKSWGRQIEDFFNRLGVFWITCPQGQDLQAARAAYKMLFPSENSEDGFDSIIQVVENNGGALNIGMMYPRLSSIAARALKARKNLRNFRQVEEERDWN